MWSVQLKTIGNARISRTQVVVVNILASFLWSISGFVFYSNMYRVSLGNQPTFRDATTGFPAKWRLRNDYRNSILMTCHYPDLGSAFDWSCRETNLSQPIRNAIQIWVMTCHRYGISAFVSQTSFRGETRGGVVKCRLFSQASTGFKVYFCWRFLKNRARKRDKETKCAFTSFSWSTLS